MRVRQPGEFEGAAVFATSGGCSRARLSGGGLVAGGLVGTQAATGGRDYGGGV